MLEKPPKFKQKSALAAHFYNINMQLTSQQQAKYQPAEGRTLHDLEAAWTRLEKAEHERELALKKELNRQEQLEQLYAKFDKKAKLREDWLSEMANILSSSLVADTSQLDMDESRRLSGKEMRYPESLDMVDSRRLKRLALLE